MGQTGVLRPVPAAANLSGHRPAGKTTAQWLRGVSGSSRKGAPLAPPWTTGAAPKGCFCRDRGRWGGLALGGHAQALGLFRMSSTSASTISRTSSWDQRQRVGAEGGVSGTLSWGHLHPRGGSPLPSRHPIWAPPAPSCPPGGHPPAGPTGLALRRGGPRVPPRRGHLHQKRPGASSSASVSLWCSLLAESPEGGERERRAWSGWRSRGRRRSRLPLPSTRSPPGTSPWLWEP